MADIPLPVLDRCPGCSELVSDDQTIVAILGVAWHARCHDRCRRALQRTLKLSSPRTARLHGERIPKDKPC